jgi:type IV pilus assembly protein PilN
MANINLLPWREWERERKKREFLVNLAGAALIGVVIVLAWGQQLDGSVTYQQGRNEFLRGKIAVLDSRIAEIANLRKERAELLDRMRVIQELQGNRPVIVRIFDEMVQTLPSGVHFSRLEMLGNTLSISGLSESNNRISALMRNLDGSDWFASPVLKTIKEETQNNVYGKGASVFDLTVTQVNPNAVDEDAADGTGAPAAPPLASVQE